MCETLYYLSFIHSLRSTCGGVDKRSPQSHLCDPGSIPVLSVSYGLSLLLVLSLFRRYFSGFSGFPPSTKPNTFQFPFDLDVECLNTTCYASRGKKYLFYFINLYENRLAHRRANNGSRHRGGNSEILLFNSCLT